MTEIERSGERKLSPTGEESVGQGLFLGGGVQRGDFIKARGQDPWAERAAP